MKTNFINRAIRNYRFTIVLRRSGKTLRGIVNASNDYAAKNIIETFGFNDKNSRIIINAGT